MGRGDRKRGGHLPVQISTPSLEGSLLEGKGGHLSSRTGKRAWGEGRSLTSPQSLGSLVALEGTGRPGTSAAQTTYLLP